MGTRIRFGEVYKKWVVRLIGQCETYMRAFGRVAEGCEKKKG
jgi:hypothetical protein